VVSGANSEFVLLGLSPSREIGQLADSKSALAGVKWRRGALGASRQKRSRPVGFAKTRVRSIKSHGSPEEGINCGKEWAPRLLDWTSNPAHDAAANSCVTVVFTGTPTRVAVSGHSITWLGFPWANSGATALERESSRTKTVKCYFRWRVNGAAGCQPIAETTQPLGGVCPISHRKQLVKFARPAHRGGMASSFSPELGPKCGEPGWLDGVRALGHELNRFSCSSTCFPWKEPLCLDSERQLISCRPAICRSGRPPAYFCQLRGRKEKELNQRGWVRHCRCSTPKPGQAPCVIAPSVSLHCRLPCVRAP